MKLELLNDPFSQELTTASLVNSRAHRQVLSTFRDDKSCSDEKILKKFQFLRYQFIFVTYLLSEVDGRIMSEIYFWMKIGYEDLRESRS